MPKDELLGRLRQQSAERVEGMKMSCPVVGGRISAVKQDGCALRGA
jgi:hypothetical protein